MRPSFSLRGARFTILPGGSVQMFSPTGGAAIVVVVTTGGKELATESPVIFASTHDTKISSVHLHTHIHRSVTRPVGPAMSAMSAGKLTVWGKLWPLFQWSMVLSPPQCVCTSIQSVR